MLKMPSFLSATHADSELLQQSLLISEFFFP